MKFALYTDAALTCDLPEHRLRRGDIVKLVDHHTAPDGAEGYSIEVFNAVGDTIAVGSILAWMGETVDDVVPEDAARVWVERDDRRAETGPDRLLDGRPMAPMDAVEGADRDGALGRLELSRCADDLQMASSGRSRSLGTGDGMSHRTPARAPTVVIQSAGRNPSAAPSQPPARDPSGRMP